MKYRMTNEQADILTAIKENAGHIVLVDAKAGT